MTVWECMCMLGGNKPVRIMQGDRTLTAEAITANHYATYPEEYPDNFEDILEMTAIAIDLEEVPMIIYVRR